MKELEKEILSKTKMESIELEIISK